MRSSRIGDIAALVSRPGPQLRQAQRVEGARGDAGPHRQALEPVAQLARGPAGEGDGEHVRRVEALGRGPPRDPAGQDPGLARTGPGEHGQRRRVGDHGAALLLVEPDE